MDRGGVYVLKITGKLFNDDDINLLRRYREVLLKLIDRGYRFVIVVGGGYLARKYIGYARSIGISSMYWLDMIGIHASRLNALLVAALMQPHSYPYPVTDALEAVEKISSYKIVVMGGLIPGQSTATTAVEVAEAMGADTILNASLTDRVYDKDPAKYSDAKPLPEIRLRQLMRIIEDRVFPGEYVLLDRHAISLMMRSKIKMYIFHYKNPEKIIDAIEGRNPGTIVLP